MSVNKRYLNEIKEKIFSPKLTLKCREELCNTLYLLNHNFIHRNIE